MTNVAAFPGVSPGVGSRRKPGRPRVEDDPEQRRLHIAVATFRHRFGNSVEQTCNRFGISPRTVHLWANRARSYPEAAALFRR